MFAWVGTNWFETHDAGAGRPPRVARFGSLERSVPPDSPVVQRPPTKPIRGVAGTVPG